MSGSSSNSLAHLGPYSITELRAIIDKVWDRLQLPLAGKPRVMRADVYDGETDKPTILLYRETHSWGHYILVFQRHTPTGFPVVEIFDPVGVDEAIGLSHYLEDDLTSLNGGGLGKYLRRAYEAGALINYNEPEHGTQIGDNSCGAHAILRAAFPTLTPAEYSKRMLR